MKAQWLTTRSQANWMVFAGIITSFEVIESNVAVKKSKQHPEGYEVCRVEADIVNPKGDWEQKHCGPGFSPADDGCDVREGYHNDWRWIQSTEQEAT